MKPKQCMSNNFNSYPDDSTKPCWRIGEFRIKDTITEGDKDDGYSYYCDVHIGDHLHYCVKGFESTGNKVKEVILKFVDGVEDQKK